MNDTHEPALASAPASRREFTKRAAALATSATLALPLVAGAQTTPQTIPREATAPPNPLPSPSPAPAPNKLLDAYVEVARERFGEGLSAEELARVRTDLAGNLRTATRLSQAKLTNADEPDFIFKA